MAEETMQGPTPAEARAVRDRAIVRRYQAGEEMQPIALSFGITSERVRQILVQHGVERRRTRRTIAAAAAEVDRG